MANSLTEENYGFNLNEWMNDGPSVIEQAAQDYVEIQVTEEEVISDHWDSHPSHDMGMSFRTSEEDNFIPIPSALKKPKCEREPIDDMGMEICNLCGADYSAKDELVEHMRIHAVPPRLPSPINQPIFSANDYDEEEDEEENVNDYIKEEIQEEEHDNIDADNTTTYNEDNYYNNEVIIKKEKKHKKKSKKRYDYDSDGKPKKKKLKIATTSYEPENYIMEEPEPKFPIIDPSRPYVCQHCGVGFAREKALSSHNMVHVGDSAFECDICHDMFGNEGLLLEHRRSKHGTNFSKKKSNFTRCNPSSSDEFQDESLICNLCYLIFEEFDDFLNHKSEHDCEIGVHACGICADISETVHELKQHMKKEHSSRHACIQCDKMFRDESMLRSHLAKHDIHIVKKVSGFRNDVRFACPSCPKRYQSKIALRRHISMHDADSPSHNCVDCDATFNDGSSLLHHRQNDHGLNMARLFPCVECGKTFNSRSSQQIHIRIHTGEKPYSCRFCWKAFGDGGTLRKHERIHTGEKPYVCPICSKAFNQRVVLREHVRAHHSGGECRLSDTTYECLVCGNIFRDSGELCAHLVQHSDDNTARHRLLVGRKINKKKRSVSPSPSPSPLPALPAKTFPEFMSEDLYDYMVKDRVSRKKTPSPIKVPQADENLNNDNDETEFNNIKTSQTSLESPKKARIVHSGKKGFQKGQNRKVTKSKIKSSKSLKNSTSYASKYAVSHPVEELEDDEFKDGENGVLSRNRPRTKNVNYHNMKDQKYEVAKFPEPESAQKRKKKKRSKGKGNKKKLPDFESPYINGIDDYQMLNEDVIEECIVDEDDIGLAEKLYDPSGELLMPKLEIDDLDVKPQLISCDLCCEVFLSHNELARHVEAHI